MSKLVVFMSDGTILDVPLARERTTIGRRADNDICLPDLSVSGEHAVVVTILADSFLEDLGSTNGTLVNGTAIAKHFLRDRDQVQIGRHKLVYCVDDEATMTSELVGLARINARDFGERVKAARPFTRRSVQSQAPNESAQAASDAPAIESSTPVATPAAVPGPAPIDAAAPAVSQADTAQMASAPLPAAALASINVLSGVSAGVSIPLIKDETTIGRPGVQVASIVRTGAVFRLKPLEGAVHPAVNGRPTDRDGIDLAPGDIIEIAGTRLEFVDVTTDPARNT